MIRDAYDVTVYQLSGGPGWLDSGRFGLEAKAASPAGDSELREMLQTLLAERCQLTVRRETKDIPVYEIRAGKNGPTLPKWKEGDAEPKFTRRRETGQIAGNMIQRGTMQHLADLLSTISNVGRPAIDKAGLDGMYILAFSWYQDEDSLDALQEVSGLRFESVKVVMPVVVIDRIEKPSGN
jgi:uncharacterized protein (TIGR03435 family)